MKKKKAYTQKEIETIAAKLISDGMAVSNFTTELAHKILKETVAPNYCIHVFDTHKYEILHLLPAEVGDNDI